MEFRWALVRYNNNNPFHYFSRSQVRRVEAQGNPLNSFARIPRQVQHRRKRLQTARRHYP